MPETLLETSAASQITYLVTFTWGTSNVARYCKSDADLTVGGSLFTADPLLSIDLSAMQQGGVEDAGIKIQGNASNSPFKELGYPWPHAKVKVTVDEMIPGNETTRRTVFFGRVKKAKTKKATGLSYLEVSGIKAALEVVVGRAASTNCDYPGLGLGRCGSDLVAGTITGTITDVGTGNNPNALTTNAVDPAGWNNNKWNRGYVEYDGLRIGIRQANGAGVLSMKEPVPPSWAGVSAKIVPGCRKDIANCRYHNMEDVFGGIGYKIPAYNPVFTDAP